MRRKHLQHSAFTLCHMFCGWRLINCYNALARLGSGVITIDAISGACQFNGKPIEQLSIALELRAWLAEALAANKIPVADLRRAVMTAEMNFSMIPAKQRTTNDFHMDQQGRTISEGRFNQVRIACKGEVSTDEATYTASFNDLEEWPEGWPGSRTATPMFEAVEIIENLDAKGIEVWFESWGMPHTLPPGKSFRVVAVSDRKGQLEIEREATRVVVYAWPGCTMRVYCGDQLVEDFSARLPDVPPGMSIKAFVRSMFGGSGDPGASQTRPTFEIEGARCATLEDFYGEVSRVLIPGAVWGHNLDAFNDILHGGFGTPVGGFRLLWKQSEKARQSLGHLETARQLRLRLASCHPSSRTATAAKLTEAESGRGETVFDWLVEIIREHQDIELVLA